MTRFAASTVGRAVGVLLIAVALLQFLGSKVKISQTAVIQARDLGDFETSWANSSLVEGDGAFRRAMVPSADADTFDRYHARGCVVSGWMKSSLANIRTQFPPDGLQRPFQYRLRRGVPSQEVSQWSDTSPLASRPLNLIGVIPELQGLSHIIGFARNFQFPPQITFGVWGSADANGWRDTSWVQDKDYQTGPGNSGPTYPATNARFRNIFNFNQKILLIMEAASPRAMATLAGNQAVQDNQLPLLSRWSDIVFLSYAAVLPSFRPTDPPGGSADQIVTAPVWTLVKGVLGPPETRSIISKCLGEQGIGDLPTWDHRITLPIGSSCFYALLGIANSYGVAMQLVTHKFRYGSWRMGSVTVYDSGTVDADGYRVPNLLWWATKYPARGNLGFRLDTAETANSAYEYTPEHDIDILTGTFHPDWPTPFSPA